MWIEDVFKKDGILDKLSIDAVGTFFLLFAWSGDTRVMKTPGTISYEGVGLSDEQYCAKLRMTPEKFHEMVKILSENQMITYEKGVITIVNFDFWQNKKTGDDKSELKFETKFEASGEVNLSHKKYKKLRSKEVKKKEPLSAHADPCINEIVSCWNKIGEKQASSLDIVKCTKLTDSRERKLKTRLKDPYFEANWKEALRRAFKSSFIRGITPRGPGFENWRADFEWFLKPDTVTKLMEGKHDDKIKTEVHEREAD